jgi:hypothetical protein
MQVHGLVGQTEEGIWPEAQLRGPIFHNYGITRITLGTHAC